jgi:hypothetical protein
MELGANCPVQALPQVALDGRDPDRKQACDIFLAHALIFGPHNLLAQI